jgi:hypothetical protein
MIGPPVLFFEEFSFFKKLLEENVLKPGHCGCGFLQRLKGLEKAY